MAAIGGIPGAPPAKSAEGDALAKDFFLGTLAGVASASLVYNLKHTQWIPQDHQSMATVAAIALGFYSLHRMGAILKRGYDVAWREMSDLTARGITIADMVKAILLGAGVAWIGHTSLKWDLGPAFGIGITTAVVTGCLYSSEPRRAEAGRPPIGF